MSMMQAVGLSLLLVVSLLSTGSARRGHAPFSGGTLRVWKNFGNLPLRFEATDVQAGPNARYFSRGPGYNLSLSATEAMLALRRAAVRLTLKGGNPAAAAAAREELPGKTNYLLGNDPRRWRTGIASYAKVHYREVYPGIDLVYYGNQQQLEHDFIVAPGADSRTIRWMVDGSEPLALDADGRVRIGVGDTVVLQPPVVYQKIQGERRIVRSRYVLNGREIGFEVGDYDPAEALIIDPVVSYSTLLGGGTFGLGDRGTGIAVDVAGNAYLTGMTESASFPTTAGSLDRVLSGSADAFVVKLNPSGTALVYSTFLGGPGDDRGAAIAVDASGNAYVTGVSYSSDFPTTTGAAQRSYGGSGDAFISGLNAAGTGLLYSTYLGGSGTDSGMGIARASSGSVIVTGTTDSSVFPTTTGSFQAPGRITRAGFVARVSSTGGLVYSTAGIGGNAIAVDSSDNAYITGSTSDTSFPTTAGAFDTTYNGGPSDAFVAALNSTGSALLFSTFLGGRPSIVGGEDEGTAIALDSARNVYVTGYTRSQDFPMSPGAYQDFIGGLRSAFITKLDASGRTLLYSTFLGGRDNDSGYAIAVDSAGNAYVTGETVSRNFPTTSDALDTICEDINNNTSRPCSLSDAFLTVVNPAGTGLVYSTYLGGGGADEGRALAFDSSGTLYITGYTAASDFLVTPGAYQTALRGAPNVFVTKMNFGGGGVVTPAISLAVSPSAVSLTPGGAAQTANLTLSRISFTASVIVSAAGLPAGVTATFTQPGTGTTGSIALVAAANAPTTSAIPVALTASGTGVASATATLNVSVVQTTACTYSLSPASTNAGATGGTLQVSISTQSGCAWSATSQDTWLTITSARTGSGSGTITVTFTDNTATTARTGRILIGSQTFTLTQAGRSGSTSFEPSLTRHLTPGFYILEATLASASVPSGFWGLEVLTSLGRAEGGFNLGGAIPAAAQYPGFGAFLLDTAQTVTATVNAQLATGAIVTIRFLDSNKRVIGQPVSGLPPLTLAQRLDPGFYIVEVYNSGSAPATYQLGLATPFFVGGVNTGGYLGPGLVGFGAFYVAQEQDVTMHLYGRTTYGAAGAGDLALTLRDAQRRVIATVP